MKERTIMKHMASFGSWKSPITSDLIVSESIKFEQVVLDGSDIYWIERRPAESGRCVIVRRTPDGNIRDMLPPPYNARTSVHEYGGGSFTVSDGTIYFSNFSDQHVYRLIPGSSPQPIAFAEQMRYADYVIDHQRNRIICVREDHTRSELEPMNTLVSVSLDGSGKNEVLVSGNDFYSSPRLSPDGSRLAWLTWNHPDMPWDGCELWCGDFATDGLVVNHKLIAGGARESIFQPEWSPDGVLHFVSDRTGWWNIYRAATGGVECLHEMRAEFALPQWVFGLSTYAFASAEIIVCAFAEKGIWNLGTIDTRTKQFDRVETPYTEVSFVQAAPQRAVFRAGSPNGPFSIVEMDLTSRET